MKILFFGRGAISTQYAWAMEDAGHEVVFYIRPGRKAQYGNSIKLNLIDGRAGFLSSKTIQESWTVKFIEAIPENHDFDLIFLSVNHSQFKEAADFLSTRLANATLLIFNNFWKEPLAETVQLPQEQLVWGFPVAGGRFNNEGILNGAFMKRVNFGTFQKAQSNRDKAVRMLFKQIGFNIIEHQDFRSYLFIHFAVNTAMNVEALKAGSIHKAVTIPNNFKEIIRNIKELLPLLHARGVRTTGSPELRLTKVPASLNIPNFLFKVSPPIRMIMTAVTNTEEIKSFGQDVLTEARKLNIKLPRFEVSEKFF